MLKEEIKIRTTGIQQFFDELPDYIIPVQKVEPPYMPYEAGYGYLGVLLCDTDKDRVQCHVCGRWYKALSAHLKLHGMDTDEYKDRVGLFHNEPLMSLSTLEKFRSTNHIEQAKINLSKGRRFGNGNFDIKPFNQGSSKTQWQNKHGTCEAQLKFRLDEAIKKYGKLPTVEQEPALVNVLRRRFGSYKKALIYYKFTTEEFSNAGIRRNRRNLEREEQITPSCKTCGNKIERKVRPSGKVQHILQWLNTKTCSKECYAKYLKAKATFRECSIEGCINRHQAGGLCMPHYLRKYKQENK